MKKAQKTLLKKSIFFILAFTLCQSYLIIAQTVSTFAGSGVQGSVDGTGTSASFNYPGGICSDSQGNFYVTDASGLLVRKISSNGIVSTIAGTGTGGYNDGTGVTAQFNNAAGLCTDAVGNIYVADMNNARIRKITPSGIVSTYAGSSTYGSDDGPISSASFSAPYGICIDTQGNLYISDIATHKIRKISSNGIVSTLAGTGAVGDTNGPGATATFNSPRGVCVDASGNVYIADMGNNKIKKITPSGVVSTFAGSGIFGNVDGLGINANLMNPHAINLDSYGDLYVTQGSGIRKITLTGLVSTIAGSGFLGSNDGPALQASFNYPSGICSNNISELFVADMFNHKIRKITPVNIPNTKLVSTQCGQLIPDLYGSFYCDAVSGAQDYEWEITNTSLGYSFTKVRGLAVTSITKTDFLNLQFGQTYNVRVRAKVGGVWGNFGTTCSITLGNPVTQLQATDCGATFANLNGHFFANQLFGAQDYQWEFTNTALGYSFTKIRNQAVSSIPKTDITGLQFGQTYQVRVKAKVGGIWGSYGPSCSITLGAFPTTKLISSLCGATFNLSGWFYCDAISGAQDYEWEFTNSTLGYNNTLQRGLNVSSLGRQTVTGLLNGQTYNVRVRAKVGGIWGTFGNSCVFTINTSSPTRMANAETSNDIDDKDKAFEIIAFPNPFTANLSITINGLYEFEKCNLEVYNGLGEKIYSQNPSENIFEISLKDLANGIYYISVTNGNQKVYKKIVKQE